MTESEYRTFVENAYAGRTLVGVDRPFARKLFTDTPAQAIVAATGEAPYLEKGLIMAAFIASPVALLGTGLVLGLGARWWLTLLVAPMALIVWLFNKSRSSRGDTGLGLLSIILAAAVANYFLRFIGDWHLSGAAVLFALAVWADRFVYVGSTFFLRNFVLRNQRALEAFGNGLTIRHARPAA